MLEQEPPLTPVPDPLDMEEERLWGMLAHLLGALLYWTGVGHIIAPLVVYFVFRDRSRFVAFHALQATYFQILSLVVIIVGFGAAVLTCGLLWPLAMAIPVVLIIYNLIAAFEAYKGRMFEYVIVGPMARRHVGA